MEWISVNDKLPTDEDSWRYFICMTTATGRSKGVIPMRWDVTKVRGKIVRRWKWEGRISPWEVTHWMPLPDPPKEEGDA